MEVEGDAESEKKCKRDRLKAFGRRLQGIFKGGKGKKDGDNGGRQKLSISAPLALNYICPESPMLLGIPNTPLKEAWKAGSAAEILRDSSYRRCRIVSHKWSLDHYR